jgi:polysaccharide deacetylase 2 family uncharacterized protein YibQ
MTPKSKARFAFVSLFLSALFLVIALVTCLPREVDVPGKIEPSRAKPPAVASPEAEKAESLAMSTQSSPGSRPWRPEKNFGDMAVVIDDAGYSLTDLQPFLDFPEPLTIAVIPNLANSEEAARRVRAAGKGLLMHCPMEPLNGENPGPGVLRTDQSDQEIERLLDEAFASVPGAEGLNNHMGSKATADERLMTVVIGYLKRQGKYMVDSRTTVDSKAGPIAARLSVPFLQRDVFVDNEKDEADISSSIQVGATEAGVKGAAILIGHVHTPQILAILKKSLPSFKESGIRLVGLQEMLARSRESQE